MTPEQEIKIELVVLAEYLQCGGLSDAQVRLYADELSDLGPANLRRAISALKADTELWPGRFPLPAKLRSYVEGDIKYLASDGASRILACHSYDEVRALAPYLQEVAKEYSIQAIIDRNSDQTSTIFAQLRDLLKAKMGLQITERRIGLPDYTRNIAEEIERAKNPSLPTRIRPDESLVPGRTFDESDG